MSMSLIVISFIVHNSPRGLVFSLAAQMSSKHILLRHLADYGTWTSISDRGTALKAHTLVPSVPVSTPKPGPSPVLISAAVPGPGQVPVSGTGTGFCSSPDTAHTGLNLGLATALVLVRVENKTSL